MRRLIGALSGLILVAALCASAAWSAGSSSIYRPNLDMGTPTPLVVGWLSDYPPAGFGSLPTSPFVLNVENDLSLTVVFTRQTQGATATFLNASPLIKAGVLEPNTAMKLNVTLNSPSSVAGVKVSIQSAKAVAVNVLGDAILGSFAPFSAADVQAFFDATSGTPAPLITAIKTQVIEKVIEHAIKSTTAIARLSKLLIQIGTNRTYRKWFLQHLGKKFGPISIAKAVAASAEVVGAYWGLASGGWPGEHTLKVSLLPVPPFLVAGGDLPDGAVSHSYDQFLSASGGVQPYSWTITDGSLPPGLTLNDNGEVTGTPVQNGTYQFTAQATDGNGDTASGTYSLTVAVSTSSPGQITEYDVGSDLGCAMYSSSDTNGEFYGQDACGTFIAVGGQLYGPSYIPAGENLGAYNSWTPINQSTSGSGTSGDPFVTTTDASADGSPITISETDTYAVGGHEVATDVRLFNSDASSAQLIVSHGFDCFAGDSDIGSGTSSNGSVSCVSSNFGADGARTLKLTPLTSGSTFVEENYANLWSDIATQGLFSNTVEADTHDTAEGLAWPVTVPANGSVTISFKTDLLNTQ